MTSLFALSETGKPNTTGFLERGAWNKDCEERKKGSVHEWKAGMKLPNALALNVKKEKEREETQTGEVGEKVLSSLLRPGILRCFYVREAFSSLPSSPRFNKKDRENP